MKKLIITMSIAAMTSFGSIAQIVNGNFESWPSASWEALDEGSTSATEAIRNGGTSNAAKSTDKNGGNYAIRLETVALGGDTSPGFFIFGEFGDNGPGGGVSYTQMPTALTGYYKSDIKPGDSALVLVIFFDNDTILSQNMFTIGGAQSTFTQFTMPLNLPSAPDSVLIAGTSSNPFTSGAQVGSWIIYDDFMFTGTGITQQVNNTDFEDWTTASVESPEGWLSRNLELYDFGLTQAEKTTDSYRGNYALKLNSFWNDNFDLKDISNVEYDQNGPIGGWPFTTQNDTLIFYYKYIPQEQDTASIYFNLLKNSSDVGSFGTFLFPSSSYTMASIPFSASMAPDTMRIYINSSRNSMDSTNDGSALYIDEIQLKSSPLNTGVQKPSGLLKLRSYPNPATDFFNIDYSLSQTSASIELNIYNLEGKNVFSKNYGSQVIGRYQVMLDLSGFSSGLYTYDLKTNSQFISGKILVE